MQEIEQIISCLEKTPEILKGLLSGIPDEVLKTRRIENSWSIHEHACHIATGDRIGFVDRLHKFLNEEFPVFVPVSGESYPPGYLMEMNLSEVIGQFSKERAEAIRLARSLGDSRWHKEGRHPEYVCFTPLIMLRHRLFHDHLHMYRIEELWLTRGQYLGNL